jgi:hypothetical protein
MAAKDIVVAGHQGCHDSVRRLSRVLLLSVVPPWWRTGGEADRTCESEVFFSFFVGCRTKRAGLRAERGEETVRCMLCVGERSRGADEVPQSDENRFGRRDRHFVLGIVEIYVHIHDRNL